MDDFSAPTAFHFDVAFQGSDPDISDTAFQEVTGLEVEMTTEPLQEGGENRFVHNLPKQVKHKNLSLKRALTGDDSGLVTWCQNTLEQGFGTPIKPQDLLISLLNEEAEPVASWSVTNAFPVKWTTGNFDAMKNELAIETVELSYLTLERKS
ncbi:phage tail protein [Loktanella sp. D2R18]|jgi:phage tail-like protein|uniref:phage tail protein n=1 Tax=Rhodobacterales TaxID=204455 RepID=UPI000DE9BD42|nr:MULTISPECIES: phage tail protein [Rhodobacterales]MDO6589503.1 phage tail protein [Yoonia sp. 1_MG-2023]RBW44152.1 phage tail protein [Loktanella sp. D2R18]